MSPDLEKDLKKEFSRQVRGEEIVYILDMGDVYSSFYFDIITNKAIYRGRLDYEERPFLLKFLEDKIRLHLTGKRTFTTELINWKSLQDKIVIIATHEDIQFRFYFKPHFDPIYDTQYRPSSDLKKLYCHIGIHRQKIDTWLEALSKGLLEEKSQLENEIKFENTVTKEKQKVKKRIEFYETICDEFINYLKNHSDEIDEFLSLLIERDRTRVYE